MKGSDASARFVRWLALVRGWARLQLRGDQAATETSIAKLVTISNEMLWYPRCLRDHYFRRASESGTRMSKWIVIALALRFLAPRRIRSTRTFRTPRNAARQGRS